MAYLALRCVAKVAYVQVIHLSFRWIIAMSLCLDKSFVDQGLSKSIWVSIYMTSFKNVPYLQFLHHRGRYWFFNPHFNSHLVLSLRRNAQKFRRFRHLSTQDLQIISDKIVKAVDKIFREDIRYIVSLFRCIVTAIQLSVFQDCSCKLIR